MQVRATGQHIRGSKSGPVLELLPWQWLVLYILSGLYAFAFPLAGGFVCALLVAGMSLNRSLPIRYVWVPVAFGWGLLWAWLHTPAVVPCMPEWMEKRKEVQVRARVEAVTFKPEQRIQIILDDVHCQGEGFAQTLPGKVVWTWQEPLFIPAPGQGVRSRLRIKPVHGFCNFHTWDSRAYWARKGVLYRCYTKGDKASVTLEGEAGKLWTWREKLRLDVLQATDPGPGQGLLLALLMGDRSHLSYSTLDLVRRASLAHTLALSGLHLGFVITLGWGLAWALGWVWPKLFWFFPRPLLAVAVGVPLVIAYLWLGQGRDSLLRAALMFFFWALLMLSGRNKALLDGLFFAVAVFILCKPMAVFSLGWQLSMVAVAGILLLWPLVGLRLQNRRSWSVKLAFFLGSVFLLSIVANTALLPLLAANFGQLSPHLYLNVIWLPILGFCVLPLGLGGLVLNLLPGNGIVGVQCLHLAAMILERLARLLEWLNAQGWLEVVVTPRPGWLECLGYWTLLGALVAWVRTRSSKSLFLAGMVCAMLCVSWLYAQEGGYKGRVQARILDVGQGQAVCLEDPQGHRTLVDGGGSWNPDFDLGRFALSPALTYRDWPKVETVVLTHPDFDHLRGLFFILKHYAVDRFLFNGQWPQGEEGRKLRRILKARDIQVVEVEAGDRLSIGNELILEVLHPASGMDIFQDNDRSLVLRAVHRGRGLVLVPGDIEDQGIKALLKTQQDMQADLLIVPHHGSRGSLSPKLYARVDPELAVVSCGFLNIFRFPHSQVAQALTQTGVRLERTSRSGEVRVQWDLEDKGISSLQTRLDPTIWNENICPQM